MGIDQLKDFRNAYDSHKTIFNEGVSLGLTIAIANIEKEERDEQIRRDNYQSNLRNLRDSVKTSIRSNEKGAKGRS